MKGSYYKSGRALGQVIPGSPVDLLVQELRAELDAMHFPTLAEPRGFRIIEDASGFPMPLYDPPPIRRQCEH